MANFKKTQNSFSSGEISPDFFANQIPGAMSKLENIQVTNTGILARRPGTIRITELYNANDCILIPFGDYLLSLTASSIKVFQNNSMLYSFALDWNITDIHKIQWVQRLNAIIFVHPDSAPKILQKTGSEFSFTHFKFAIEPPNSYPILPFMRYPDTEDISITLSSHSNGNNWATATASAAIWNSSNAGGYLYFMGRKWVIYSYVSPTQIVINTPNSFTMPTAPITDWKEVAFSARRGWPRSVTYFQDRLVFGGSRDWPCGLWLSKTGIHNNFDTGTGLDDEAIFITLLSETQQKICSCISSRDLQVLTDYGEWAVSANPLTPSNINVRQHTSIGTITDRFIPPQRVNGNTIFVSRNPQKLRELALDELGENYDANDLTLMARHLINNPTSMAYSATECALYVVMQTGEMAVLTKQPALNISAWCKYTTAGLFKSVALVGSLIYTIVKRGEKTYLEVFSASATNDSGSFNFSYIAQGTPLLIEKHSPQKIRTIKISANVSEIKHIKIQDKDFYFDTPASGDVSANILGYANPRQPLWQISSDQQLPSKILSVTTEGLYEI